MGATQNDWPWQIDAKDLYHVLIDTRNLEVNLLWQRTNYFLALNSAIVVAFFSVKGSLSVRIFALIGFLSSVLWFYACLASKYWQTFWHERLAKFEEKQLPCLGFFSANADQRDKLVEEGLRDEALGRVAGHIYWLAKRSRSVSFAMLLLAAVFIFGWLALFASSFLSKSTS